MFSDKTGQIEISNYQPRRDFLLSSLVSPLHDEFEGEGDGADHGGEAEAGQLGLYYGMKDVGGASEVIHYHLDPRVNIFHSTDY